ncbi:prophage antirepressor-like protein [Janthinobacterium sp. CAN_S1]|uniref:BRO-N domain-containing protein n=1 Tax=Janthinobacterium sp. CAN_S1 TaxID=2787725 RepID=UPI0018CB22CB
MSNLPVVFNFGSQSIRTIDQDGEVWFVANDVCTALDISNPRQAITRLDEDERGVISNDTPSGTQELNTISESGLYSLVMSSRKSEAKQFKRWVTHEVLRVFGLLGGYYPPLSGGNYNR